MTTGLGPHNYASYVIYSADDLVHVSEILGTGWLFRGQADSSWDISSTLERTVHYADERASFEAIALKEAEQNGCCLSESFLGEEDVHGHDHFSWLALLQHHGCHTRLVDFSECFNRAVYFAVRQYPQTESAVWALSTTAMRDRLKGIAETTDGVMATEDVARRLINNSIDWPERYASDSQLAIAYGSPDYPNKRMLAQRGTFLCSLNLDKSFMENLTAGVGLTGKKEHVPRLATPAELADEAKTGKAIRICIPESESQSILSYLYSMDITESSLFPGPDGFARGLNYLAMGWSEHE